MKYETLGQQFQSVFHKPIPRFKPKSYPIRTILTNQAIQIINQIYANDFKIFKYPMIQV